MSEIKYLSDGRKVSVVGKLNAAETIVQEIFVSGGNEIPSGENFVVKSLHDEPVVSWKEKNLKEINDRYETESVSVDRKLKLLRKQLSTESQIIGQMIQSVKTISDSGLPSGLLNFLEGRITHTVEHGYSYKIRGFSESLENNDRYDTDIKLMTLYGKSNGDLEYRINQYCDGSGSSTSISPAQSFKEAKEILEKVIVDRDRCGEQEIKAKAEYSLSVPTEKQVKKYNKERIKQINISIQMELENVDKKRAEIKKLKE